MPEIKKSANTVEEAVSLALEEINKTENDVKIEVLQDAKKAFFGLGGTKAIVKVSYEEESEQEKTVDLQELQTGTHPKTKFAVDYLTVILEKMDLSDTKLNLQEAKDGVLIDLTGPNVGTLIGRRGETLDALQYLVSLSANKIDDDYFKITLDSNSYRSKREKTLEGLAKKIARTVLKTGRSTALEPMNPYERRIIHTAVSEVSGVQSKSVGEEPYRKVVISSTSTNRRNHGQQTAPRRGKNFNKDNKSNYRKEYEPKRESNEESLRQVKAGVDAAVKSRIFDKIGENDKTPLYTKIDFDEE